MSYVQDASFDWDPKHLRFANKKGDAAWLSREYRGGWTI
jgi:hypothetical protein